MSIQLPNLVTHNIKKITFSRYSLNLGVIIRCCTTQVKDNNRKFIQINPELIVINKDSTRYRQRLKKRLKEEYFSEKIKSGELDGSLLTNSPYYLKRKKFAILLGYCGADYSGMQWNYTTKTIEKYLFDALLYAKYIYDSDYMSPCQIQYQRCSRTDKGVSAARQLVSLLLPLGANVDELNKRLPESIRVFGIKRVTGNFDAKDKCTARTYTYTLPTYALQPNLLAEEKKLYRITQEKLETLKNILNIYKGCKKYHNFTVNKFYHDPSALRMMFDFSVTNIFVENDMEFAVLEVKGQSFMLHQIRKMVGLAIAICRGVKDMSIMDRIFGQEFIPIAKAPGLGLVLEKLHFDSYDKKFGHLHGTLTWESEEEAVERFKKDHILPVIIKGELENNNMDFWLNERLEKYELDDYEDADKTDGSDEDEIVKCNEYDVYRDDEENLEYPADMDRCSEKTIY